jgi:hypothetical protein
MTAAFVPANGNDFLTPSGNVYQLSGGRVHLIPNVPTANAMGLHWKSLASATVVRFEGFRFLAHSTAQTTTTQSVGLHVVRLTPLGSPLPSVCGR